MKLSLCCISEILAEQKGFKFETMTLTRFLSLNRADAVRVLSKRILHNFFITHQIIKHCHSYGIAGYRLSSTLTPVINHPDVNLRLQDLPDWPDMCNALHRIANEIKSTGVRISAHPSEYITLTSQNPDAIRNSVRDLISHAELFDMLDLPQDYRSPLNIHCRQDGDCEEISQRFLANYDTLPRNVKSRLVVEVNDNVAGSWNIANLHRHFFLTSGIPVTYDSLHRQFCNSGTTDEEDFNLAYSTWNTTPLFHFSEGVNDTRKHADMPIGKPNAYGKDVFFDVELKGKDKAIFKLLDLHYNL